MIRLGRPKAKTSVSATGLLAMDLAPDAAWGAARVESWCALALDKEGEREGAVAVVRRQLAAHPDDIDVNVVDPRARGGWTALLIAWCVTPRPPFNLYPPTTTSLESCIFHLQSSSVPRQSATAFLHLLPLQSADALCPVSPPPHCSPALHLLHHHSVVIRLRLDLQSPLLLLSSAPALSPPTVH